jgi:hypothetical protein
VETRKSWQSVIDLGLEELPALDLSNLQAGRVSLPPERPNNQDRKTFEKEQSSIAEAHPKVVWIRPSAYDEEGARQDSRDSDDGRVVVREEPGPAVAGGAVRGLVLHKLMEEILRGLLEEGARKVAERAETLTYQLGSTPSSDPGKGPSPEEMAATVLKTLNLPVVRDNRKRLLAEVTVHGAEEQRPGVLQLVSGVADAIAPTGAGGVGLVIEWKSDVELTPVTSNEHHAQLRQYMKAINCPLGAIVYMTLGQVDEVRGPDAEG